MSSLVWSVAHPKEYPPNERLSFNGLLGPRALGSGPRAQSKDIIRDLKIVFSKVKTIFLGWNRVKNNG